MRLFLFTYLRTDVHTLLQESKNSKFVRTLPPQLKKLTSKLILIFNESKLLLIDGQLHLGSQLNTTLRYFAECKPLAIYSNIRLELWQLSMRHIAHSILYFFNSSVTRRVLKKAIEIK